MVTPCEMWQISLDCEISNWMTMILELTVAGIFAIILSVIFYRRQKDHADTLFKLENDPDFEITSAKLTERSKSDPVTLETFSRYKHFKISLQLSIKNHGKTEGILQKVFISEFYQEKQKFGFDPSTALGTSILEPIDYDWTPFGNEKNLSYYQIYSRGHKKQIINQDSESSFTIWFDSRDFHSKPEDSLNKFNVKVQYSNSLGYGEIDTSKSIEIL